MLRTHEDQALLRTVQLRLILLPDDALALSEHVPSVRPVRPPAVILPSMTARNCELPPPTESEVTVSFMVQLATWQLLALILAVGTKRTEGSRAPPSALTWSRSCWKRVATSVVDTSVTSNW